MPVPAPGAGDDQLPPPSLLDAVVDEGRERGLAHAQVLELQGLAEPRRTGDSCHPGKAALSANGQGRHHRQRLAGRGRGQAGRPAPLRGAGTRLPQEGHGAGRVSMPAAPPAGGQAHQAGGTYSHDNRGHVDQTPPPAFEHKLTGQLVSYGGTCAPQLITSCVVQAGRQPDGNPAAGSPGCAGG